MTTASEARLLLSQLLSPAFPVGGFAYSQGLEVAMASGLVRDAASLRDWVEGVVLHGSGRMDAVLIGLARRPGADLAKLAELAFAYAPSAERSFEMRDQGRAFCETARALGLNLPDLPYPLALGAATAALPLDTPEVTGLCLQALAAQLVSAAVRYLPLSAALGQGVVASLAPAIARLARDCAGLGSEALASSALGADLAAMAHETLQPRIFRT